MRVLFLCSGNICRSPMAAEYFRARASGEGMEHIVVDSAGTLGIEGQTASAEAVQTLREVGLDLAAHRSRGVRGSDLRTADLIVVMEHAHLEWLERRHPERRPARFLLRAFETGPDPRPGAPDLEDPIQEPPEVYRSCFETIRTCVDHLLLHLKHRE